MASAPLAAGSTLGDIGLILKSAEASAIQNGRYPTLTCLVVLLIAAACGGDRKSVVSGDLTPTATTGTETPLSPTSTDLKPPTPLTIKVMSYNVLWGGGADSQFDGRLSASQRTVYGARNRVPDIVSLVKQESPDILGVQEAAGWNRGSPPLFEQIASELGMHSYFAAAPDDNNQVIFSKYRILEVDNIGPVIGRNGGIKAKVELPDGLPLYVFVVHLDSQSIHNVSCQLTLLQDLAAPLFDQRVVMLGDLNAPLSSSSVQQIVTAGWNQAAIEQSGGIDQIWVAPSSDWESNSTRLSPVVPARLSDHRPVIAEIKFSRNQTANQRRGTVRVACDAPPKRFPPITPSESDRIIVGSMALNEPLIRGLVAKSGFGALPNPPNRGVIAYDFSEWEELGGVPGDGNLGLAALSSGPFKAFGSLHVNDKVELTYAGLTYVYTVTAICRAPTEGFSRLLDATNVPIVTLFPLPVGTEEFLYAVGELRPNTFRRDCPIGVPN